MPQKTTGNYPILRKIIFLFAHKACHRLTFVFNEGGRFIFATKDQGTIPVTGQVVIAQSVDADGISPGVRGIGI